MRGENSVIEKYRGEDWEALAHLLHESYADVALEFGLTQENAPTNAAFIGKDALRLMKDRGCVMFTACVNGELCGFAAVYDAGNGLFYLEKICVHPDYRHKGIGRALVKIISNFIAKCGGSVCSIGIIEANGRLKRWYEKIGFRETEVKKYEHLPFDVCFMRKIV